MHSNTMKVVACQRPCSLNANLIDHTYLLIITILCLILCYNHLMCLNTIISSLFSSSSVIRGTNWLQTTQPTRGGTVTNCCANCVEHSQTFTVFFGQAGHADPLDGWRCSSQKGGGSRLSRSDNIKQMSLDL